MPEVLTSSVCSGVWWALIVKEVTDPPPSEEKHAEKEGERKGDIHMHSHSVKSSHGVSSGSSD